MDARSITSLSQMPANNRWSEGDVLETFNKPQYELVDVTHGMTLTHTASNTTGTVVGFSAGDRVVLLDRFGQKQSFPAHDGAFVANGSRAALRAPTAPTTQTRTITASGSVAAENTRAKVARASRIWVEGVHDAELVEKIWGDDLRDAAIVVEPMHGADDLGASVALFNPRPTRRLGILLDHLVVGSKETRLAAEVRDDNVLITGHPYVDIWMAIDPHVIGLDAWPNVPKGRPWKDGVLAHLGIRDDASVFWSRVLDAVGDYRDLETPLVNAVERLLDFVILD